jgi:hypothetical protein
VPHGNLAQKIPEVPSVNKRQGVYSKSARKWQEACDNLLENLIELLPDEGDKYQQGS